MLSEEIGTLAERFEGYAKGGVEIDAFGCGTIGKLLRSIQADAQAMERVVVPADMRMAGVLAGGNVVSLQAARYRRDGAAHAPGGAPTGGDAA